MICPQEEKEEKKNQKHSTHTQTKKHRTEWFNVGKAGTGQLLMTKYPSLA